MPNLMALVYSFMRVTPLRVHQSAPESRPVYLDTCYINDAHFLMCFYVCVFLCVCVFMSVCFSDNPSLINVLSYQSITLTITCQAQCYYILDTIYGILHPTPRLLPPITYPPPPPPILNSSIIWIRFNKVSSSGNFEDIYNIIVIINAIVTTVNVFVHVIIIV